MFSRANSSVKKKTKCKVSIVLYTVFYVRKKGDNKKIGMFLFIGTKTIQDKSEINVIGYLSLRGKMEIVTLLKPSF